MKMHVSAEFHAVGMAIDQADHMRKIGFTAVVVEIAKREIYVFFW